MANKYLNDTGLSYFYSKLKSLFQLKESGKGLSTNDYTTAEKNKLAGIAAGAEVNQNAFSNVKVGSTTLAADSKTDTLNISAGTNITLTPTASSDSFSIATSAEVNQNAYSQVKVTTPADGGGYVTSTLTANAKSADITLKAGENITLTPDSTNRSIEISSASAVTGVKGNSEQTYRTGDVNITKENIGLGNVDNTADASKQVAHADSADELTSPFYIDGFYTDGTTSLVHFGTCTTASNVATKVISLTSISGNAPDFRLVRGAMVTVEFDHGFSGKNAGVMLNVASTGAKLLVLNDNDDFVINDHSIHTFVYDGTSSWAFVSESALMQKAIADALAGITSISYEVVNSLPQTGQTGVIYLLKLPDEVSGNRYEEYLWIASKSEFEKIGSSDVDLSGYMLKTDMVAITTSEIDTICV